MVKDKRHLFYRVGGTRPCNPLGIGIFFGDRPEVFATSPAAGVSEVDYSLLASREEDASAGRLKSGAKFHSSPSVYLLDIDLVISHFTKVPCPCTFENVET